MKCLKFFKRILLLSLLTSAPAYSLGPVDGEIGVAVWNNHFDADVLDGELDAGTVFAHGELWLFNNWGIRAAHYDADLEGEVFEDQRRLQLEVRKRFLSAGDNNFFALGAGVESIDLENGESSDGLRLSAEARLGLPSSVFLYGRFAWTPVLQSAGNFDDISATEVDIGAHFTPLPFVSLRLGYLQYELDYENTSLGADGGSKSSGIYLGAGFHW